MFRSLSRTLSQLADPRLRGVLWISVGVTLAVVAALAAAVGVGLDRLAATGIGWLDGLIAWLGGFGSFVLLIILLPGSVQMVSGLFADRVMDAVEDRHYPGLPALRVVPISEQVLSSLRFAGLSVLLNLLALPLYLILPGINLLLFYGLNGYLLGREYAEMVALRRMPPEAVLAFRRAQGGRLFLGGVCIAVLSTVPVANLALPVVATAFAVHEHQRLQAGAKQR